MQVYFTSDLHLGHKLASEMRGFDSVESHDDFIIKTLNKVLNKRTILFVLGDVAMDKESLKRLKEVSGVKKMLFGNHDQFPLKDYLDVFDEVHGFFKYKNMWLSHCPIHPQEMYRVDCNIHGHIHKNAATKPLDYPYINVNWDFWSRPIKLEEIRAIRDFNVRTEVSRLSELLKEQKDGDDFIGHRG